MKKRNWCLWGRGVDNSNCTDMASDPWPDQKRFQGPRVKTGLRWNDDLRVKDCKNGPIRKEKKGSGWASAAVWEKKT